MLYKLAMVIHASNHSSGNWKQSQGHPGYMTCLEASLSKNLSSTNAFEVINLRRPLIQFMVMQLQDCSAEVLRRTKRTLGYYLRNWACEFEALLVHKVSPRSPGTYHSKTLSLLYQVKSHMHFL